MDDKESIELEAKLIEQDHRTFRVLWNVVQRNKLWPAPQDPRRDAAIKALIWSLLSPGAIVVGGGGLIAAITLWFYYLQTKEIQSQTTVMMEQNLHFLTQNSNLLAQIDLQKKHFYQERRTELITALYGDYEDEGILENAPKIRIKKESLVEYIQLEKDYSLNSYIDLSFANLKHIDIEYQILTNLNLCDADLTGANLYQVDLTSSELRNADLTDVSLSDSNLAGVDFSKANLSESDLSYADLSDANLFECDLRGSDFEGANLSNANLRGARLTEANFDGANLSNVDFRWAYLSNILYEFPSDLNTDTKPIINTPIPKMFTPVNFDGADLSGALFKDADLSGADLSEALNLSLEQIKSAKINEDTKLPNYLKSNMGSK